MQFKFKCWPLKINSKEIRLNFHQSQKRPNQKLSISLNKRLRPRHYWESQVQRLKISLRLVKPQRSQDTLGAKLQWISNLSIWMSSTSNRGNLKSSQNLRESWKWSVTTLFNLCGLKSAESSVYFSTKEEAWTFFNSNSFQLLWRKITLTRLKRPTRKQTNIAFKSSTIAFQGTMKFHSSSGAS